jgi:hypothetical protein
MSAVIKQSSQATDEVLNALAHLPTKSLRAVVEKGFFAKLGDRDFMRVAYLLAKKSFDEGGCPIGAVIVDSETREIIGKGHNTLVQATILITMVKPRPSVMLGARISAGRRFSQRSVPVMFARLCFICVASAGS